jgi:protein-tyrosine phosphatase
LLGETALELRCPDHDAIRSVLRTAPVPLALAELPIPQGTPSLRQILAPVLSEVDLIVGDGLPPLSGQPTAVALDGESWNLSRPGVLSEEAIREQAACLIVFVCTGNTCRSPLAEALCKRRLAETLGCGVADLPQRGFLVTSAGLAAAPGMSAASEAISVARSRGGILEDHSSKPLAADLAARADYLIGMTRSHLRALKDHYPNLGAVPRLLNSGGDDLADPVGMPRAVYEDCARQIDSGLAELIPTLIRPPSTRDDL